MQHQLKLHGKTLKTGIINRKLILIQNRLMLKFSEILREYTQHQLKSNFYYEY